jgi:hypothetical protein
VSIFSVSLLSLIIPTDLYIYGLQEYNQSLAYKYGNTTERLKLDIQHLYNECVENIAPPTDYTGIGSAEISFQDKCKPVIKYYEDLGWFVTNIGESIYNRGSKYDSALLSFGLNFGGCVADRFEQHVLLTLEFTELDCQKVLEYYLGNGYDLVDKYDEKVELIKKQGPPANNSSQLNP